MSRWDRPPPPIDWRWWVGGTGRILITIGVLMFGFVAYQLWGTAIETARAQRSLESDFDEMLAEVQPVDPGAPVAVDGTVTENDATAAAGPATNTEGDGEATSNNGGKKNNTKKNKNKNSNAATETTEEEPVPDAPDAPVAVPVADQSIPDIHEGDALARLEIPRIGVDHIVVAGVSTGDLKKGPGHYPDTPLPGQLGNSAIAGHRTTYGQPFYSVEQLEAGDEIVVTTLSGRFVYRVTGQEIVGSNDYEVVATVDPTSANLTLTSCHPRWTAQQRIVVYSELVDEDSAPVGEPVLNYGRPPEREPSSEVAAGDDPATTGAESGSNSPSERPARDDPVLETGNEASESVATPAGADASAEITDASAEITDAATTGSDPVGEANSAAIADAFSEGWFSDPGAPLQVALWALLLAAIGSIGYLLSRAARSYWVGGLVFILPFLVTLYFFYQNVNRLLPPNL